ncbi:hypothetical protein GCM10014715_13830 [Streptomyces spiralis]|uniref:Uncharacterized protein n=1 Tax=Streptomyces spiralis TaxID=66376 RepID=A0A918ZMX6_9ACTN|nr:hypothetical protein GCM10014715_13830 [Streptomyces spiralis]
MHAGEIPAHTAEVHVRAGGGGHVRAGGGSPCGNPVAGRWAEAVPPAGRRIGPARVRGFGPGDGPDTGRDTGYRALTGRCAAGMRLPCRCAVPNTGGRLESGSGSGSAREPSGSCRVTAVPRAPAAGRRPR